jgi:hypothetical protein
MRRILLSAAVLSLALAGTAQAQTIGTATTALNIRSGPGPEQPVIGYMKARQRAQILGCVEGSLWCQVQFRGRQGWAYSQYMSLQAGAGRIVIVREPVNVAYGYAPSYRPDIAPLAPIAEAITSGARALGATEPVVYASTYAPPPRAVGTYVTNNAVNSFAYDGNVMVGAGLPQTVVLNNVPDYRYQYVYVNNIPVLVDPATRRIVYVFQ